MSIDEPVVADPVPTTADAADQPADPSWWHRSHPVFTPLAGFFTGLVFIAVVPALYAGLVGLLAGSDRVEALFPYVVLTLSVPLILLCWQSTRRFAAYMWLGLVTTVVVVLGVGGLVLWYMVRYQS